MNKTKSRYPSWWAYYHLARNAYFLLGIPCLLLYSVAYTSDVLDDNLRHSISLFILSYGCYFGIDIKNGTMLYVRIYPNNVMDVIGLDIHNFTRTVAEDGKLEIHTTYVSLPMIPLEISGISARTLANTMHTMAARGYEYKERFPQMIRYRVKEWEKVAGVPVAEVF